MQSLAIKSHPGLKLARKLKARYPKAMKSAIKKSIAPLVLSAPAGLATIIRQNNIEVHSKLKILIYGAKQIEILDDCTWYQTIPAILGETFTVETVSLGRPEEITKSQSSHTPQAGNHTSYESVEDLLNEHAPESFDIAVSFAYGGSKQNDQELRELLTSLKPTNTRVFAFHYTPESLYQALAHHHFSGFTSNCKLNRNLYSLPMDKEFHMSWGSFYAELVPADHSTNLLPKLFGVSADELLATTSTLIKGYLEKKIIEELPVNTLVDRNYYHTIMNIHVDIASEAVFMREGGEIHSETSLSELNVRPIDFERSSYLERFIWSLIIASRYANALKEAA